MKDVPQALDSALLPLGFRRLGASGPHRVCCDLWKRQTLIMNRAVAIVRVDALPDDLAPLLKQVKKEAASRCGFFPFFYGLGTLLVLIVDRPTPQKPDLLRYVDKFDNQWSIVQSIFVVHSDGRLVDSARTWGQIFTGKYHDAIFAALF